MFEEKKVSEVSKRLMIDDEQFNGQILAVEFAAEI